MQARRNVSALVLFLLISWASAYAHHVAVVAHQDNGLENISSAELARILKSEIKKWPDGHDVMVVINRNSVVSMHILERLTSMSNGKARTFAAAHRNSFLLADSDGEVLERVANKSGALGMVDVRAVDSRIKVLKVDGKLPLEKGYLPH
jgi:ABC-type phosphate transport system substrate-binding protein